MYYTNTREEHASARQVTHFDMGLTLGGGNTACGRSLHGWNMQRPKNITGDKRYVTCKRCTKALERMG